MDDQGTVTANNRGIANITASGAAGGTQYDISVEVTSVETVYVKNFYDSTYSGNTEKINKISTAVSFLNLVYYDEFQLKFEMDGSPVQYEYAGVDICPHGEDECDSSCGISCLSHHKNIGRIATEMYYDFFEFNRIVVMWSDSDENAFCVLKEGVHKAIDALAATMWDGDCPIPVVQVFRNDPLNEIESMAINLAHEVAHTLGLKEIYLNQYGDDEYIGTTTSGEIITRHAWYVENEYCIMKNYDCNDPHLLYALTIYDGLSPLCENCIQKLQTEVPDDAYES